MKKLTILLMLTMLLISAKCTEKYSAPDVENCTILTSTCYCVDKTLKSKNYDLFIQKVTNKMVDHHEAEKAIKYVIDNEEKIVKEHAYELPMYYCRGHHAVGAIEKAKLEVWAEDNRIERIKCEKDLQDI